MCGAFQFSCKLHRNFRRSLASVAISHINDMMLMSSVDDACPMLQELVVTIPEDAMSGEELEIPVPRAATPLPAPKVGMHRGDLWPMAGRGAAGE